MRQLEQHQKQRRVRSLAEKWQSHTRQLEQWQKQRRQLAQRQAKWPSHMRQLEHQQGRQLAERQAKWQSHVRQLEQQQRRHCQLAEKDAKLQHERPDACKGIWCFASCTCMSMPASTTWLVRLAAGLGLLWPVSFR
uniref:Uncharacterized protein n=1 Tax=Eutreptiella gymnastica TaxID=73025 RepID=A0A6T2HUY3_9EUGL